MEDSTIVVKTKKKPIYKKWWFWVIAVFVLFGIGSLSSEPESSGVANNTDEKTQVTETSQPATTTPTPKPTTNQNSVPAATTIPTPTSGVTVSQKNAVSKAKSYLNYTGFSHDGLVTQLEYEKFSHDDAVYGVDHSGANWNDQAAKKAKSYMDYSSFSRGSLIAQLEYDKFTQAQAEYGANAVGL